MSNGMTKKGSGQFTLSREIGGSPNSTSSTQPSKGSGPGGGANISVDSSVKKPPTRRPSK